MSNNTLFLLLSIIFPYLAFTQNSLPTRPNQVDKEGRKQGDWIYYYDADWNIQKDDSSAQFYRLMNYKDAKPTGKIRDYFGDGRLQMEADSIISEDPDIYEGNLSIYSEDGNINIVEYHHSGQMDTSRTMNIFKNLIKKYQTEMPNHVDLAFTINNLAYLYREQAQYDTAEFYYRMAKEIREDQVDGKEDIIYSRLCNKLGYVLMQQGKLKEAEPMYLITKEIHGKLEGKYSDYAANSRNNLAYIYMKTDRYSLAESLYREAADQYLESHGIEHDFYLNIMKRLAQVYAKMENWEKALEYYIVGYKMSINDISKEHLLWFVELLDE